MKLETDAPAFSERYKLVVVDLCGEPVAVDQLKDLLIDFVKKQENPTWKYY